MSRPPAHWKRYRGGTAPRLWLDRAGDGSWERLLPDVDAGLVSPNWIGDTLVFASGQGATFSRPRRWPVQPVGARHALGSGEPTQVTPPRHGRGLRPRPGGRRRADRVPAPRGALPPDRARRTPAALDVTPRRSVRHASGRGRRRRPNGSTRCDADQGGDASAVVEWRGKRVTCLAHREGPARAIVADSGRTRSPACACSGGAGRRSSSCGRGRARTASRSHDLTGATAARNRRRRRRRAWVAAGG